MTTDSIKTPGDEEAGMRVLFALSPPSMLADAIKAPSSKLIAPRYDKASKHAVFPNSRRFLI